MALPTRHDILYQSSQITDSTGTELQTQHCVRCADDTVIVLLKQLQDRESFTINKRGKTLLLPLFSYKTASYYFIFKVWFLQDSETLKKKKKEEEDMSWYEECCKSLKTLWKAINQWLVPQILTLFASMVQ